MGNNFFCRRKRCLQRLACRERAFGMSCGRDYNGKGCVLDPESLHSCKSKTGKGGIHVVVIAAVNARDSAVSPTIVGFERLVGLSEEARRQKAKSDKQLLGGYLMVLDTPEGHSRLKS